MYTLHCTKKLLDRIKVRPNESSPSPTTALGSWYATALFWKPQVALLVNERTLLPVLISLAPVSTLTARIPTEVGHVLSMHGAGDQLIANELADMAEANIAKTDNRRVIGTMNEFVFLAQTYRADIQTLNLGSAGTLHSACRDTVRCHQASVTGSIDQGSFHCVELLELKWPCSSFQNAN